MPANMIPMNMCCYCRNRFICKLYYFIINITNTKSCVN